jgi:hypothetical protein
MRGLLAFALLAACGGGGKSPETVAKLDGTATLAGKPAKLAGCKIEPFGEPKRSSIVIELDGGLRFLSSPAEGFQIAKGDGAWTHPECSRIVSSSEGGDGWMKGKLGATCKTPDGELVLDATFDCGVVDRPTNRKN